MASTYSTTLRIELPANGDQAGTWGTTTNTNLGSIIEQAITGITTVDVTSADITLTALNGAVDQARSAVLVVNGSNVVTRNVIIPNVPKTYIVTNNTSQIVGVKTASGTAFSCSPTTQTTLYCNGSNVVTGASIGTGTYTSLTNPLITGIRETATITGTGATGTIAFYTLNQAVLYSTTAATANWGLNFTGNATTTLDSLMSVGQSFSTTFLATQGTTAYYNTAITVDGVSITPKWQGAAGAPTSGNMSGIDVYTYALIKIASATFTVLASQSQFT